MKRKKLSVIYVMGMNSYKYGGLERFIISLGKILYRNNVDLVLIYNSLPNSNEFLNDLKTQNIRLLVSDALRPVSLFKVLITLFHSYEVLAIHSHFQPWFSTVFGWFLGCKKRYVTLHSMLTDKNALAVNNYQNLSLLSKTHRFLLNTFTTKFLPVSVKTLQQYTNIFPSVKEKIQLFYLGIEPNSYDRKTVRVNLKFNDDTIYIGCAAFASSIKGIDVLIDAISILKTSYFKNNLKFCLFGLDDKINYTKEMKERTKQLNIESNIIWFGIRNDIPELLPAMDIYVQPSRSEALPFTIMEAGTVGLACVGSDVGGVSEILIPDQTGLLFQRENKEELAAQLLKLIENEDLRIQLGKALKMHVLKNFNMNYQAEAMSKLYL
jgi:glycosyltransferase involved in cell wall biosynthesis